MLSVECPQCVAPWCCLCWVSAGAGWSDTWAHCLPELHWSQCWSLSHTPVHHQPGTQTHSSSTPPAAASVTCSETREARGVSQKTRVQEEIRTRCQVRHDMTIWDLTLHGQWDTGVDHVTTSNVSQYCLRSEWNSRIWTNLVAKQFPPKMSEWWILSYDALFATCKNTMFGCIISALSYLSLAAFFIAAFWNSFHVGKSWSMRCLDNLIIFWMHFFNTTHILLHLLTLSLIFAGMCPAAPSTRIFIVIFCFEGSCIYLHPIFKFVLTTS